MTASFDITKVRRDFPVLGEKIRGKDLVYFDNGATTQKPLTVIYALQRYYARENANIHRGVHFLSQQATFAYERARGRVSQFINARESSEVVFVRGTTEALNLVAHSYGRSQLGPDDEVIVSQLEHHSNIVPWQLLCEEKGAHLRVVPISETGEFLFDEYEKLLSERTRIVAVAHASNALGTILPVKEIAALAHQHGAVVVVDGAQGAPHLPVDVQDLDCDFYAFSGHKLFGPTGIGVLYGKQALLHAMPPYEGGGSMIEKVSFAGTTYAPPPMRFEAGTPHIAGVIGLETAIDYVNSVGKRADRRVRGRPARVRRRSPRRHPGTAPDWHGPRARGRPLLYPRRHPPARHRHHPRRRGHCRARWPPLRPADHAVLPSARYGARLVGFLQHARGN